MVQEKITSNFNLGARRRWKLLVSGVFMFLFSFVLAYVVGSEGFASRNSHAATASIATASYSISAAFSDTVALSLQPNVNSGMDTKDQTVTVTTNTAGYRLYLSMSGADQKLYKSDDNTKYLTPTASTALSDDSWGYHTSSSTNFAAVPAEGNEAEIYTESGLSTGNASTNTHTVTFGAKASATLPAGLYSSTITYGLVVNNPSSTTGAAEVSPNTIERKSGQTTTLKITTSLMTNMDLGTTTDWTAMVGTNNCTVTSVTKENGQAVISCTISSDLAESTYTVTVTGPAKYGIFTAANALTYYTPTYNYTINYNNNAGGEAVPNMPGATTGIAKVGENTNVTLPSNTPTRTYYNFLGWNENSGATAATYAANGTYIMTNATTDAKTVNLHAIWQRQTYQYSITYDANGGTGAPQSVAGTGNVGEAKSVTLSGATPTRDYHDFLGWSESNTATAASWAASGSLSLGTPTSTATIEKKLYAVWKRQTYSYTINYDANGGSGAPSATTGTGNVGEAKSVTLSSTTPTRTNYDFLGWSESNTATTASWAASGSYSLGTPTSTATIEKTLHAVWKRQTYNYNLYFNLNGGAGGPGTQSGTANAGTTKTVTIPKSEPTKSNMVFLGWADTLAEANAYTVKHKLYSNTAQPNTVSLNKNTTSKTLYAVWADDMTIAANINKCKYGVESTAAAVTNYVMADPRDKKAYVTRRLKDGQCWMAQNLDLDIAMSGATMGTTNSVTNDGFVTFTNANTNLAAATWVVTSPNAGYATQTSTGTKWNKCGSNNSDTESCDSTYEVRSYDIDAGYPARACYTDGTAVRACTSAVGAADVTRAGNYYNWPAATAGTGTYSVSSGDVAGSICPAGWQLPYGNDGTGTNGGNTAKGFYYLLNSLGTSSDAPLLANPYSYLRAGIYYYSIGGMSGQTTYGYYWSRMAISQSYAYRLGFDSSSINLSTTYNSKGYGYSVRCVAQ